MAQIQREPEEYARALLAYYKLDRLSEIAEFANQLGLKIREVDSQSFEGALIRIPNKLRGIIAVKKNIREPGRKVFTIAHEIGHFILPGHGTPECYCTSADIDSWKAHIARQHETAANRFASELLIPKRQIYEVVNKRNATIALAKELSQEFNTSLTAAAIKCVEATEEKCAVIWSMNKEIKWSKRSDSFWHFIPRNRLGKDTLTGQLFEQAEDRQLEGEVLASSWIENNQIRRDEKIWEDSIYLPSYNAVLTILTLDA